MSSSSDDIAVCAVCFNKLVEPRQLPCGHVFCTACLQSEIDLQTQITTKLALPCPSCDKLVKPTTPNINQSAWAKTFPIVNMAPFRQTKSGSRNSPTSDLSVCSAHNNSVKNVFCPDCRAIICQKCAKKEHAKCKKVVSLKNAVAIMEQKLLSYLHDIKEEEKYLKMVYPDLLTHLQNAINCVDRDAAAASESIKLTSKQLVEKVYKKEEELLTELHSKHRMERERLEQSYDAIDFLKVATTKIASLQKSRKDVDFVKNAEEFALELSQNITDFSKVEGVVRTEMTFVPDDHTLLTFKLGKLKIITKGLYN